MSPEYIIFTDGSTITVNDMFLTGYGIVILNLKTREYMTRKGDLGNHTIRYAESYAIYKAIAEISRICQDRTDKIKVLVISDSKLDIQVFNQYIPYVWDTSSEIWYTVQKRPVKNQEIYKNAMRLINEHKNIKFKFAHINSHKSKEKWARQQAQFARYGVSGDKETILGLMKMNSLADKLASSMAEQMRINYIRDPNIVRLKRKCKEDA